MSLIRCAGNKIFEVISRSECLRNHNKQEKLRELYNSGYSGPCICQCIKEGVPCILVCYASGKVGFRTLKGYEHAEGCALRNIRTKSSISEDKRFDAYLLAEPNHGDVNKLKKKGSIESTRRNTFSSLVISLVAKSSAKAFNMVNKNWHPYRYSTLKQPSIDDFFRCFHTILNETDIMKNNKTVNESIQKTKKLSYGFFYRIEENKMEVHEVARKKEFMLKKKVLYINTKQYKKLKNFAKVHKNTIVGPYFYFALIDSSNTVIRIYAHPVAKFQEQAFVFIDSNLERVFAMNFFKKRIIFLKPINTKLDYKTLGNKLFNGIRPDFENYIPDFILFFENIHDAKNIPLKVVIEVCGFPNDQKYMTHFNEKMSSYQKIQRKHKDFKFFKLEEKDLSHLDDVISKGFY